MICLFAIISVMIVLSDPFYGLLLLVLVIPMEQITIVSGMSVIVPIGAAVALSWFTHIKKYPIKLEKEYLIIIVLIFMCIISLLRIGKYCSNIQSIVQTGALVFIVSQITNTLKRIKLLITVIGMAFLISTGYQYIGEPATYKYELGERFTGLFFDPNYLSLYCLAFFPPIAALFLVEKRHIALKLVYLIMALNILFCFFMTYSRGGYISAISILLIYLYEKGVKRSIYIYTLVGCATFFWITYGYENELSRAGQLLDYKYYTHYTMIMRVESWISGIRMFLANPILGVGFGEFSDNVVQYAIQISPIITFRRMVCHNSYIEMIAELGLVGGLPFFAIMYFTTKNFWKCAKDNQGLYTRVEKIFLFGIYIGALGFMIGQFFVSAQVKKYLWLFVGLSIALKRISNKRLREIKKPNIESIAM